MTGADVLDLARMGIWLTLRVAGPLLLLALLLGVAVSLFQALTQIQEFTLTFVPKILGVLVLLFLLLPWYGDLFKTFADDLFDRIVRIGMPPL
ncbi:MAG: flagellar biosynthesis protein FliQ [Holosporaceae bacterium]